MPLLTVPHTFHHLTLIPVLWQMKRIWHSTCTVVMKAYPGFPLKILEFDQASRAYGKDGKGNLLKIAKNNADICSPLFPCQSPVWASVQNM